MENQEIAQGIPTLRLYKGLSHYLEDLKIEVKPRETECWDTPVLHEYSVRYVTFTGMTMLHEYLKLCYMSSEDPNFFPRPEHISIHLISTVGGIAKHYIHRVRGEGKPGHPIKYVSTFVREFDLKEADQRNMFRKRLNQIHVLHMTTTRIAMQNKIREVLALGPTEI